MITLDCVSAEPPAQAVLPLLDTEDLTVTMGTGPNARVLVRDVSLRLLPGATLGIVGESGSGKSLTARSLIRLLPAGLSATGRIRFAGTSILDASEREMRRLRGSRISLLMQDPFTMLNPLQTIHTHIAESLAPGVRRSRSRTREEVERRLGEVGLAAAVMSRYPFQLSGGMRQRAALAAALARDPELLIADEPTTALDVTTQADVLALLKQVQRHRRMGLILITHDLRLAFSVCDTIQVMYAGSLAERAPAADLARRPAHPYSLGLLRSALPVSHYLAEIPSIPGRVPSADSVSGACAFANRCEWVDDRCVAARPPLRSTGPGRWSACLRTDEIGAELRARLAGRTDLAAEFPVADRDGDRVLAVRQLRKTYRGAARRDVVALDDVSFDVAAGEAVGLVGETGSGKTTITRCVLGLTRADAGRIEIAGQDATDYRRLTNAQRQAVRATVQVVFQDPYASLNPARTVGATLREALQLRDRHAPTRSVEELLESVALPAALAARRPAALSGGERQRVAIARALALRPRLLICDEPVASLDASAQAQILELLRRVRAEWRMSMLFITHDLSVVRQMAERIIVLYQGKIVEQGPSDTVLDRPGHAYTQRLLAAVPHGDTDI